MPTRLARASRYDSPPTSNKYIKVIFLNEQEEEEEEDRIV